MKTFSAKSHGSAERMFSASLILMRKESYGIQEEQLLSVPLNSEIHSYQKDKENLNCFQTEARLTD